MSWIFWPMFVAASSFTVELPDSSNAKSPPDGILDGLPVDGKPVGRVLGESDKVVEGRIDGTREGPTLGKLDGLLDGDKLGFKDGIVEGDSDGTTEECYRWGQVLLQIYPPVPSRQLQQLFHSYR